MKTFVPFNKIENQTVIVVDGLHPHNLTLSHWKGANTYPELMADTSGEIVLNAIEKNFKGFDGALITATHFDIDGFVGVFALFYPELALTFKEVLIAMARVGDFREFKPNSIADKLALKLCCWMNTVERNKFYRPFGEKDEIELCVPKFNYFLSVFSDVLKNPDNYKSDWEEEFNAVQAGLHLLKNNEATNYADLGLVIKRVSQPIHYYALFSETEGYDIVLSVYEGNKYEVEYKYTTWVDIASRPTLPRIPLNNLRDELNKLEGSEYTWVVDKISDTGPILRLETDGISKADRYAQPYEREIYSSSIPPATFEKVILDFFKKAYKNIEPKGFWTWKELKNLKAN